MKEFKDVQLKYPKHNWTFYELIFLSAGHVEQ
jgi:hypothetical protein